MDEGQEKFAPASHMMDLKGKQYLPVAARVVWFRDDHPIESGWRIETAPVEGSFKDGFVTFRTQIIDPSGTVIATGHKCEDKGSFGDWLEKAETGSLGRALAACGYGTMAALDEGEIVDTPVSRPQQRALPAASTNGSRLKCTWPGCITELTQGQAKYSLQVLQHELCPIHQQECKRVGFPDENGVLPEAAPAAQDGPETASAPADDQRPVCADCGQPVSPGQAKVSEKVFRRILCAGDMQKAERERSNRIAANPAV